MVPVAHTAAMHTQHSRMHNVPTSMQLSGMTAPPNQLTNHQEVMYVESFNAKTHIVQTTAIPCRVTNTTKKYEENEGKKIIQATIKTTHI